MIGLHSVEKRKRDSSSPSCSYSVSLWICQIVFVDDIIKLSLLIASWGFYGITIFLEKMLLSKYLLGLFISSYNNLHFEDRVSINFSISTEIPYRAVSKNVLSNATKLLSQ